MSFLVYAILLGRKLKHYIVKSNSLVIRQKGESQNGCFKKTKHANFSEKRTFLTRWYAHVRVEQGVRNVCFSENLACFVILKHLFWDSPFAVLPANYNSVPMLKYFYGKNKFYVVSLKAVNCSKDDDNILHDLAYKSRQNRIDLCCAFSSFFFSVSPKRKNHGKLELVQFYPTSGKINQKRTISGKK